MSIYKHHESVKSNKTPDQKAFVRHVVGELFRKRNSKNDSCQLRQLAIAKMILCNNRAVRMNPYKLPTFSQNRFFSWPVQEYFLTLLARKLLNIRFSLLKQQPFSRNAEATSIAWDTKESASVQMRYPRYS